MSPFETATDSFRCGACFGMHPAGTPGVWMPASAIMSDPGWSILEKWEKGDWLGGTFWCEPCAYRSLKNTKAEPYFQMSKANTSQTSR